MIQFSRYSFDKIISTNIYYYNCAFTNCIIDELIIGGFLKTDTGIDEYPHNKYKNCEFKNCIFPDIQFPERYEKCTFNNNKYYIKNIEKIQSIIDKDIAFNSLPSGDITVYKKALLNDLTNFYYKEYCILELKIPANAKRIKGNENKCRASEAVLVRILSLDGTELPNTKAYSHFVVRTYTNFLGRRTEYTIGQTIVPDEFDDNPINICSHGIHFFCSFKEAANYDFN